MKDKNLSSFQQYIISKSGVEALYYQCTKLEDSKFSFYLVEPGLTSTDIIRDIPAFIRWAGSLFLKVFSHSNDKAALTALLAMHPETKNKSFIVPRGLGTMMGYPKIKKFPNNRQRENLYNL